MSALTDITSRANNVNPQRAETDTKGHGTPSSNGNPVNSKPRFMSPTVASTKQTTTLTESSDHARSSKLTDKGPQKTQSGKKWMASAAKRVGFRRTSGDGAPLSKKEGQLRSAALTFPDKLSKSGYENLSDALPSSPVSLNQALSAKPLPSPPIAQVTKGNPIEEQRSLIDASEKPLRRSSPNAPHQKEDWPALSPGKPSAHSTLKEVLHQETLDSSSSQSQIDQERFPLLSGLQCIASIEDEAIGSVSKMPSATNQQEAAIEAALIGVKGNALPSSSTEFHQPASAASPEKSLHQSNAINEPRQTRTSSLRARLSAGQIIKDSGNKVLGFTDFTAEKKPVTKGSKDSIRTISSGQSISRLNNKTSSRELLAGNRAPAQFVAGSRRPSGNRRPSSRSSLRNDAWDSGPGLIEAPQRLTKGQPTSRRSSIPVFQNSLSKTVPPAESKVLSTEIPGDKRQSLPHVTTSNGDPFDIFDDSEGALLGSAVLDDHTVSTPNHTKALKAIEESPKPLFTSKRLSKCQEYGPILKISHSADRLIMGTGSSNKENQPPNRIGGKDLLRNALTNEHNSLRNQKPTLSAPEKSMSRPSSTQGRYKPRSSTPTLTSRIGADKGRSVNVDDITVASLNQNSNMGKLHDFHKNRDVAIVDDPFSDAVEPLRTRPSIGVDIASDMPMHQLRSSVDMSPWMNPVGGSVDSCNEPIRLVRDPSSTRTVESMEMSHNKPEPRANQEKSEFLATGASSQRSIKQSETQEAPSTPTKIEGKQVSPGSGSFPPRSSSRTHHPDFTMNGTAKRSPSSPLDQVADQLQKEISASQLELKKAAKGDDILYRPEALAAQREPSSQTGNVDKGLKRDSTARESIKSQASGSRGLMSNLRGLFHKRSSESAQMSAFQNGRRKTSAAANGSPFPSISDIHPVHRPKQTSIKRSSAVNQRSSGFSNTSGIAPDTPSYTSPVPTEVSATTTLAMQILESARMERSSPRKEKLLELGKIMVDTITHARDAEKAMEEAKQAARKAEVQYILCKKTLNDVSRKVDEWKGDIGRH